MTCARRYDARLCCAAFTGTQQQQQHGTRLGGLRGASTRRTDKCASGARTGTDPPRTSSRTGSTARRTLRRVRAENPATRTATRSRAPGSSTSTLRRLWTGAATSTCTCDAAPHAVVRGARRSSSSALVPKVSSFQGFSDSGCFLYGVLRILGIGKKSAPQHDQDGPPQAKAPQGI